jgi:N-acetyl-1-D-myo-inositol-2-amino-2-deoxy-alpha-D-glucopyranoside deacetylase
MQNTPSEAAAETLVDASDEAPTEPLGAGATALSAVFGVLVGIVAGIITTFTHAQLPPWGLIAGLAIVAALVGGFRLVFGSRVVAGAAALGVVGASAVLAAPGAGGTALALDGALGYLWAFGPAVLSAIVLLIPAPGRRETA